MPVFAATNGSDDGFAAFDAWSKRHQTYDERYTADRWKTLASPSASVPARCFIWPSRRGRAGRTTRRPARQSESSRTPSGASSSLSTRAHRGMPSRRKGRTQSAKSNQPKALKQAQRGSKQRHLYGLTQQRFRHDNGYTNRTASGNSSPPPSRPAALARVRCSWPRRWRWL